MGFLMKLISLSFKLILLTSLLCFGLILLPQNLFGDLEFDPKPMKSLDVHIPADLKIIQINPDQLIKLDLDEIVNEPESLKFHNGFIYTGSHGRILKIDEKNRKVSVLTNLVDEEACKNVRVSQENCGKALDIEIVQNRLYATDAYRGFNEYDLINNTKISYDLTDKIPGYESNNKLFNSIREDPTNSDIVYISISTTKYNFDKVFFAFLENDVSGLLISFNKQTKKATVIAKDLAFVNGLEITSDKKFLLLNDLGNFRILKLDLKEVNTYLQKDQTSLPKKSVFKDKLPGLADNLTKYGKYLFVALPQFITDDQVLFKQIYVRKFVYRVFYLTSEFLKIVKRYYSCDCLDKLQKSFESGKIINSVIPYKSAIAIIDETTGNYVNLIKLPVNLITHAIKSPSTNYLYLGSIKHNQIHKINFKL